MQLNLKTSSGKQSRSGQTFFKMMKSDNSTSKQQVFKKTNKQLLNVLPNYNPTICSWDVNHMDNFIKTSPFGSSGAFYDIQVLNETNSSNKKEAIKEKKKKNFRYSSCLGFKQFYHDLNHMQSQTIVHKQNNFFDKKWEKDQKEVVFVQPEVKGLKSAQQQLKDSRDLKSYQVQMKINRNLTFDKSREQKLIKNQFKSGVLGVDSPELRISSAYHGAVQKQRIQKDHHLFQKSSVDFEFFNKQIQKPTIQDTTYISKDWKRKKIVPQSAKSSQYNLFGDADESKMKKRVISPQVNQQYNIINFQNNVQEQKL